MDRYEVMAGKMAPLTDGAHRKWGFTGKVEVVEPCKLLSIGSLPLPRNPSAMERKITVLSDCRQSLAGRPTAITGSLKTSKRQR